MVKYPDVMDINYDLVSTHICQILDNTLRGPMVPRRLSRLSHHRARNSHTRSDSQAISDTDSTSSPSPTRSASETSLSSPLDQTNGAAANGADPPKSQTQSPQRVILDTTRLMRWCRRQWHRTYRGILSNTVDPSSPEEDTPQFRVTGQADQEPTSPVNSPLITFNPTQHTFARRGSVVYSPIETAAEDDTVSFRPLAAYDTVFILDDSTSMDIPSTCSSGRALSGWRSLLEVVEAFGDIAARSDQDGVDLHFLMSRHKDEKNVRSGVRILEILKSINLSEPKAFERKDIFLGDVLRKILGEYMTNYRNRYYAGKLEEEPAMKPLNVIIITAGYLDKHEEIESALVSVARELFHLKAPQNQIGVQFLNVGNDDRLAAWLQTLDDNLRPMYGVRDVGLHLCYTG
jgi:hypothetical protein